MCQWVTKTLSVYTNSSPSHTHTFIHIHTNYIYVSLCLFQSLSLTVSPSFSPHSGGLSGKKCNRVNIMAYVFEQLRGNTAWAGNTHTDKHTCLRKLAKESVPPAFLPLVLWFLTSARLSMNLWGLLTDALHGMRCVCGYSMCHFPWILYTVWCFIIFCYGKYKKQKYLFYYG